MAARLEHVENELRDLQREHTRMIGDKDAMIALLEGEKRQLQALVDADRRQLEAHQVPLPPVPGHFEVAGDPPHRQTCRRGGDMTDPATTPSAASCWPMASSPRKSGRPCRPCCRWLPACSSGCGAPAATTPSFWPRPGRAG